MVPKDRIGDGDPMDRHDFADADRGLIGRLEPMVVTTADGRVVWDMDQWAFLEADCPASASASAHPSLWRQAQSMSAVALTRPQLLALLTTGAADGVEWSGTPASSGACSR
jgi:hypothetical protein